MSVALQRDKADRMRRTAADALAAVSRMDADALRPMLGDAAVLEFPYAPPGLPSRIEGGAAVVEALRLTSTLFSQFEIAPKASFASPDSEAVLFQCESRGIRVDGGAYANRYVILFVFHEDNIQLWREYFDPLRLGDADRTVQ
jgi:ketosteroid isomerase-like protein